MAKGIKTGGRKKGTPNKNTTINKVAFSLLLANCMDELVYMIKKLSKSNPELCIKMLYKMSQLLLNDKNEDILKMNEISIEMFEDMRKIK